MPETLRGFNYVPGGASGRELLAAYGPTLIVDMDSIQITSWAPPWTPPTPGITGISALVDTGASESRIDNLLAGQLNLPIQSREFAEHKL